VLERQVLGYDEITRTLDEKIKKNPSGFVYLDIQSNGPGGNIPIQGAIKLRSMFQILNFIGTGIRIAPEFEVGSNVLTEEAESGAIATLKINITDRGLPDELKLLIPYDVGVGVYISLFCVLMGAGFTGGRGRDEFGLDRDHRGDSHHDDQRASDTSLSLAGRRIASEQVAMGDEGVDQIGGVEQQQNEGNAEAQPLVDQGGIHPGCGNPFGEVELGRQQNREDHQERGRRRAISYLANGAQKVAIATGLNQPPLSR
jgi:hypothetical protein